MSTSSIWVRAYRAAYPVADLWAAGTGPVSHSQETQDRIFRMTEQLLASGTVLGRAPVFKALIAADRRLKPQASDAAVVAAGWAAHRAITGVTTPQPVTMLLTGGAPIQPLCQKLQGRGYEPLLFDGRDPAAYCWVIFEMRHRLQAATEAINEPDARPAVPFGLAVTEAAPPAQQVEPQGAGVRTWRS
jgi:hypothetical protein